MIDKLCAINLNYLLMKQSILIQQASLSDIEAVVRKVLDDILDDLKLQKSEDSIRLLTRTEAAKMLRISLPTLADWTRQGMNSRSTNRKTCPLCYFRYREYFRRKEGRT